MKFTGWVFFCEKSKFFFGDPKGFYNEMGWSFFKENFIY